MAYTPQVASPEAYGARADGTTNDQSALAAALTGAGAGGTVSLTAGKTYRCYGALTIPYSYMTIQGNGATIIGQNETDYSRFAVQGRTGVRFYDLVLDSSYVNAAGATNNGQIDIVGNSAAIRIHRCTFQNSSNPGIRLLGQSSKHEVEDCVFQNVYAGVFANADGTFQPINCRIIGNDLRSPVTGASTAIGFHGLTGNPYGGHVISSNVISGWNICIEVQTRVDATTVSNNVMDRCAFGVSFSASNRVTATANVLNGARTFGFEVAGCNGAVVSDNIIDNRTGTMFGTAPGVSVITDSNAVVVANNYIIGTIGSHLDVQNSNNVSLLGNHITLAAGSGPDTHGITAKNYKQLLIANNSLVTSSGFGYIYLDSTNQICDGLTIVNNIFSGRAGTAGITFYKPNSNFHRNILIQGNNTTNADSAIGMLNCDAASVTGIRSVGNLGPSNGSFNSNLNVPLASAAASTTLDFRYGTLLLDATAAPRTGTLPTANDNLGLTFTIGKSDGSANLVVVKPFGSQTINGLTAWSLTGQNHKITVQSDASNWTILNAAY